VRNNNGENNKVDDGVPNKHRRHHADARADQRARRSQYKLLAQMQPKAYLQAVSMRPLLILTEQRDALFAPIPEMARIGARLARKCFRYEKDQPEA
jgi:hypothetical protein